MIIGLRGGGGESNDDHAAVPAVSLLLLPCRNRPSQSCTWVDWGGGRLVGIGNEYRSVYSLVLVTIYCTSLGNGKDGRIG